MTVQRDMSGTMGFNEFKELWAVLNGWRQHFISFDSDRSGTVDPQELQKALTTMGGYSSSHLADVILFSFMKLLHEGSFCFLEAVSIHN